MAALGEERRFGLNCGASAAGHRLSRYHVKLTETALRALEAYQKLTNSLPNQPVICFQEGRGYIKIPAPTPDCRNGVRRFSFYLSTDSKDQPQASFDCIHQYTSRGQNQLDCLGSIPEKITVCATDDSYQMTRERMSQVEKESWSRTTIEIKPGASQQGLRKLVHSRKQPSSPAIDGIPFRKHSPPTNLCFGLKKSNASLVVHKPLRDRIIHLLALKPYKKPELILWLEREKNDPKDKADLPFVLDQVAKLNQKDNSYTIKDELYKEVQQDWIGYSEEEKQLIRRLLIRHFESSTYACHLRVEIVPWMESSHEYFGSTADLPGSGTRLPRSHRKIEAIKFYSDQELSTWFSIPEILRGRFTTIEPSQRSFVETADGFRIYRFAHKQEKQSTAVKKSSSTCFERTSPLFKDVTLSFTATTDSSATVKTEFQKHTILPENQNGFSERYRKYSCSTETHVSRNKHFKDNRDVTRDPRRHVPAVRTIFQSNLKRTDYSFSPETKFSSHSKKSKKHKEKEREHTKPEGKVWLEESTVCRVGKEHGEDIKEHETTNASATATSTTEMPDYLLKYTTIKSLERCRSYRNDFNAEYDEYRDLHARIGGITEQFVQLGSKIKTLSPGTKAYKRVEDQIFQEYKKLKKTYPTYREEKVRCEHLHRKLAHIKQLILKYDRNNMP
ncbi:RNA polymerase II elongation factor ELL [Callorhinchus milii]|uniref:RNA polymerase II elongation factor ELL n=1 Tax=Callorhinchus milii TaxID=7868 RepID=UPI001C3FAB6D|nr:RNA polymerase II elongation factor ELL [Callorhinchus milii]